MVTSYSTRHIFIPRQPLIMSIKQHFLYIISLISILIPNIFSHYIHFFYKYQSLFFLTITLL